MRILLTNDDSHQSPLLAFVIDYLRTIAELTIVVPKHEQSWKGKSMTRFGYLHLEEISLFGKKAYTIDGTPADCVNIGIHHLYEDSRPDFIVSGINAGLNAGLGFIWSSGTLGACFEANIAGVPAIAFSQHFDAETRTSYIASYVIPQPTYDRLEQQTKVIFSRLFKVFLDKNKKLLDAPITWNINFPFFAASGFRCVTCPSGQSFYGSCFAKRELELGDNKSEKVVRFEHELKQVFSDDSATSDSKLLTDGHVTLTPINIRSFAQIEDPSLQGFKNIFT